MLVTSPMMYRQFWLFSVIISYILSIGRAISKYFTHRGHCGEPQTRKRVVGGLEIIWR
jgi:hypothetical protein